MKVLSTTRSIGISFRLGFAFAFVILVCSLSASNAFAQPANQPQIVVPGDDGKRDPETRSVEEMVAKQQVSRRKKEHEEMLRQGEEALKLSKELETSLGDAETFSNGDVQKLQELEKVVSKIREELGGNDDSDKEAVSADSDENSALRSVGAAFKFLRNATVKLVDELKKSTRFSISVAAIQASNSVIKFARFLRLKK